MNDTNLCIISGRLTSKPELRSVNLGGAKGIAPVLDISIASNRVIKDKKSTVFTKVTLWGNQALYWSDKGDGKLEKGDSILVEGALSDDNYEDKETGKKTYGRVKIDHINSLSLITRHHDAEVEIVGTEESIDDSVLV